jgi:hypothetical protein
MALPNDSSKIADALAKIEGSANGYTNVRKAARSLVRKTYVLRKIAADGTAGTATAYTAADQIRMKNPGRVLGVALQPAGAATADATNNATLNVVTADGLGGAAVVAASYTSDVAGGSLAAGVTKALTVSATDANRRFAAGAVLAFNVTKAGTGVVLPIAAISVDVEEEGPDGYSV